MEKNRKKAPSTPSKEAKKKGADSAIPASEKKSKWQEYLSRHSVTKRSEEDN